MTKQSPESGLNSSPKISRRSLLVGLAKLGGLHTASKLLPLSMEDNPLINPEKEPAFNKTQYSNELSGEDWQKGQALLGSLSGLYKTLNCEPVIDVVKVVNESIMLTQNPNISTTKGSAGITSVVSVTDNQSTVTFSQFNNPNSIRETALHEFSHLVDPEQKIVGRVLSRDELTQFSKKRATVMELYRNRFLMKGLFAQRRDYDVLNGYSLSSIKNYLENPDTHPDPAGAESALIETEKEAFAEFGKQALYNPDEIRQKFPEFVELFEGIYQKISGFTLDQASKIMV